MYNEKNRHSQADTLRHEANVEVLDVREAHEVAA